jgi:hypothetical protein
MRMIESPVFLVGAERSGTTLLRLMLDHHPEVAFNQESEYLVALVSDEGAFPEMAGYRAYLGEDRVFQHTGLDVDERLEFAELANHFLVQKRGGKRLVGATVHYGFHRLRFLWPRARYIHLYRDGRDVASSVVGMGWAGNVYVAADRWLAAEREWDALRGRLAPGEWLDVRYEDLVARPRSELARLCRFLGVDFSERMFDYVATSTYSAPDPSLGSQWKTKLSRAEVQRLEAKIAQRLAALGYQLSGYPRVAVPAPMHACLHLHSRLKTLGFRVGRYGAWLTLGEMLTRRLRLARAHRSAIRRINTIVNAALK